MGLSAGVEVEEVAVLVAGVIVVFMVEVEMLVRWDILILFKPLKIPIKHLLKLENR